MKTVTEKAAKSLAATSAKARVVAPPKAALQAGGVAKGKAGAKVPVVRRTQEERRTETIGKLVDATIDSIMELGFSRTTVSSICARAGVSQGGLFRHFNSVMEVFMVAAEEVGRRQLQSMQEHIATAEATPDPLVAAVHALRQSARAPENAVIYELYVAARTNPELRELMSDFMSRFAVTIVESSGHFSALKGLSQEKLLLVLSTLLHLFDGEALVQPVFTMPGLDEHRMKWLIQMIRDLTE